MAITVTERASLSNTGSVSSWGFSPESNFTAGSFAVMLLGWRSGVALSPSITDTDGNTWTTRTASRNSFTDLVVATCDSVSLTTADTVSINWGNLGNPRCCFLLEVTTGVGSIQYEDSNSTTFASNGTITSSTIENGHVIFGFTVRDSSAAPTAYDSDTTNGSWSTGIGQGANGGGSNVVYNTYQYKIVNADGAQTYNITTGVLGDIAWLELSEVAGGTSIDPFGTFGIFGI